jgi:hypothetical protein
MEVVTPQFLDTTEVSLLYPLEDETVGRNEPQTTLDGVFTLKAERSDPGVELLRGQFLFELTQAGIPERTHIYGGLSRAVRYFRCYEAGVTAHRPTKPAWQRSVVATYCL